MQVKTSPPAMTSTRLYSLVCILLCCTLADARLGKMFSYLLANNATELVPSESEDAIPEQFIVRFRVGVSETKVEQKAAEIARQMGGEVLWIYKHVFKGFALTGVPQSNLDNMIDSDHIESIEQDQRIYLDVVQSKARRELDIIQLNAPHRVLEVAQVVDVPGGLDRIDQTSLPLDGEYKYRLDGTGVTVFVLDSGIRSAHVEFKGRAPTCAYDIYEEDCLDAASHGTHVAGIVGGKRSGVAKNVTLVAVRVFDPQGGASVAAIVAGMDYIIGQKKANPDTPMVVNMSFGGVGTLLDSTSRAAESLVDAGIVVVAAAGNAGRNACLFSPASTIKAITVGASTYSSSFEKDVRAEYSNFGPCVDIFAPGSSILSSVSASDSSFLSYSGTSMAAPHVAGAAALYLQRDPTMTPQQVRAALLDDASRGELMLRFNKGSPNKLLYTGNL